MTQYKYGTLLRATEDDPHPENDVEEGDHHIKAGKLEDGDSYTVLVPDEGPVEVEFETVEIYEAEHRMNAAEIHSVVRRRAAEDGYTDGESREAEA